MQDSEASLLHLVLALHDANMIEDAHYGIKIVLNKLVGFGLAEPSLGYFYLTEEGKRFSLRLKLALRDVRETAGG